MFDGATAERRLASFFAVATTASFGTFSRVELAAAAAAVTYVERTQVGKRPPLSPPRARRPARRSRSIRRRAAISKLIRTLGGERRGSLLAAVDRTVTAAGSRLLAQRLAAPLTIRPEIGHRLDAVAAFVSDATARADLRDQLEAAPDLARALSRIVIGRGGPLRPRRNSRRCPGRGTNRRALSTFADVPRDVAAAVAALAARWRDRCGSQNGARRRVARVSPRRRTSCAPATKTRSMRRASVAR